MSCVLPCDLRPVSLSPGSPGTLFPMVPVSPASPPRVSVHCHPGTPLESPWNWRQAATLLFPTMSLLLCDTPAPCLWQRPFGQQCMLGSELHPLALHGNASAVPTHLAPTNAKAATALLPLVTQPVLVQDLEGHGQDSTWFSCLLGAEREDKVNLALARSPLPVWWETCCGEAQRPEERSPPFLAGTLGSQSKSMHLTNIC